MDATNQVVGHLATAMITCGVGQIENRAKKRNHAAQIHNVMDIITNVWVHAGFDVKEIEFLKNLIWIENINISITSVDFSL